MVKKKFSGQTIAIIILVVLLLLTIAFGGVYAFYSARSNKASGRVVMANLKINLVSGTGESDKSEIVISNGVNVVPGQPLENTPLIVRNLSSVDIYLVVVYEINASVEIDDEETPINDLYQNRVLGVGVEYINPLFANKNNNRGVVNSDWVDYVFRANSADLNADEVVLNDQGDKCRAYRCLVSMVSFAKESDVTVIAENKLSLAVGNEYQGSSISFTFQAYAIGGATFDGQFNNSTTKAQKCETIVSAIYEAQANCFLNIDVTT